MLRTALASLRYRKARLTLSSLAILLGVAFVAGTGVLGASMNAAYFSSFAAGAKNADAAVTPYASATKYRPGDTSAPSVPARVLAEVRSAPGVASAAGRLVGQAPLLGSDGKVILNGETAGCRLHRHLQHVHDPDHPARPRTGPDALHGRDPSAGIRRNAA